MTYSIQMIFVETLFFSRVRENYMPDDSYRLLQRGLLVEPEQGRMIQGLNGARKLRWYGSGKGKRGGLRIIFLPWIPREEIWMLALYAKNEKEDLTETDKQILGTIIAEIKRGEL
jgi:hypothetical protein